MKKEKLPVMGKINKKELQEENAQMLLAVHFKNNKTGNRGIYLTTGTNAAADDWHCPLFGYKSDYVWMGTEPAKNVLDKEIDEFKMDQAIFDMFTD